jgi:nicotinamidase-related amidase
MQNGLAGKAPTIDRITHNAKRLLASADKAAIPVFWSSTFFRRSTRQPVPSCSFS